MISNTLIQTQQTVSKFLDEDCVTSICANDNFLFAGCKNKKISQWDIQSGKKIREYVGHGYPVSSMVIRNGYIFSATTPYFEICQFEIKVCIFFQINI